MPPIYNEGVPVTSAQCDTGYLKNCDSLLFSEIMSERDHSGTRIREHDVAVEEARPKLKRPPLYRVILINDDYTPMEFVVEVLETVFGMERSQATRVMLEVHTRGKGICGVYSYEIAETKVAQVTKFAQQQQHPLLCTMEES